MHHSEWAANKLGERGWQDHWVKCSTTVRLEPPTRTPSRHLNSVGEKIFTGDLMLIIHRRMRRDEHNGEYWFCNEKRVETVWSGSAVVISRNEN
jgi:hypothetical protein